MLECTRTRGRVEMDSGETSKSVHVQERSDLSGPGCRKQSQGQRRKMGVCKITQSESFCLFTGNTTISNTTCSMIVTTPFS